MSGETQRNSHGVEYNPFGTSEIRTGSDTLKELLSMITFIPNRKWDELTTPEKVLVNLHRQRKSNIELEKSQGKMIDDILDFTDNRILISGRQCGKTRITKMQIESLKERGIVIGHSDANLIEKDNPRFYLVKTFSPSYLNEDTIGRRYVAFDLHERNNR